MTYETVILWTDVKNFSSQFNNNSFCQSALFTIYLKTKSALESSVSASVVNRCEITEDNSQVTHPSFY